MRLKVRQIRLVKAAVSHRLGPGARVWLFGSRVDDSRRGGDFDFYVETDIDDPQEVIKGKLDLLADLHAANDFEGEKIDLIVKPALPGPYPPIYQVARHEGIPL